MGVALGDGARQRHPRRSPIQRHAPRTRARRLDHRFLLARQIQRPAHINLGVANPVIGAAKGGRIDRIGRKALALQRGICADLRRARGASERHGGAGQLQADGDIGKRRAMGQRVRLYGVELAIADRAPPVGRQRVVRVRMGVRQAKLLWLGDVLGGAIMRHARTAGHQRQPRRHSPCALGASACGPTAGRHHITTNQNRCPHATRAHPACGVPRTLANIDVRTIIKAEICILSKGHGRRDIRAAYTSSGQ